MIKVTTVLTCDRCGREIKAGEDYYVEQVHLFPRVWNDGEAEVKISTEEPDWECRQRELCEECRIGLYGPKEKLAESTTEETQAFTTPAIVTDEVIDGVADEVTEASPAEQTDVFVGLIPSAEEMEAGPECVTESATIAEDVETGEAVELDGKTYTEYQPETGDKVETTVTRNEEKGTVVIERTFTVADPDAQEAAERIVAMAEKKHKGGRRPITREQKEHITELKSRGLSDLKVANEVGVGVATVNRTWSKWKEEQNGR